MSFIHPLSIAVAALGAATLTSQAALTNFTDYGLGGTTASWDIFAGGNRLPAWNFSTADSGNSIQGYTGNLNLDATVPGHTVGNPMTQASGPIGTDSSVPGNREYFYTFFASSVNWGISGVAEQATTTIVLQIQGVSGSGGGASNMLLNGIAATGSTNASTLVTTYQWTDLNLAAGAAYNLSWASAVQHSTFDAFQLQTGTGAVPEPSAFVLAGASLLGLAARRSRKNA